MELKAPPSSASAAAPQANNGSFPASAPEGGQPLGRPLPVYSECGEDAVISRYFKYPKQGTYVDIGCNHPVQNNNTYLFYRLGWRGVCVDANPMFAKDFAEHRPEDKFIACGVGDSNGTLPFYRFDAGHVVSTFDKSHADFWVQASGGTSQYHVEQIPIKNVNEILHEAGVTQIDVLSVDVEMLDTMVIKAFDYNRWRPRVIAVEDHLMNMHAPQESEIFRHLAAVGYLFDSKTIDTSIYVWPRNVFEQEKLARARRATQVL